MQIYEFHTQIITQIAYHLCNIRCTPLRRRKYAVSAIHVILAPECLDNRYFDIYMLERVRYLICQKHMAYKCKKGRRKYKSFFKMEQKIEIGCVYLRGIPNKTF